MAASRSTFSSITVTARNRPVNESPICQIYCIFSFNNLMQFPLAIRKSPATLKVEGSPSAFRLPDEFLIGLSIIVRWSRLACSPDPGALPSGALRTARRLTYGIERTGAAKNRFLAEEVTMQSLHPISYGQSMSFLIGVYRRSNFVFLE